MIMKIIIAVFLNSQSKWDLETKYFFQNKI